MSYFIGHHPRSHSKPYYGVVRESRSRETGAPTGRWFWTLRRYRDGSTACRGSGEGFASKEMAVRDMKSVVHTLSDMSCQVRDQ